MTETPAVRVLVADDDTDIRDLINFKLSNAGHDVSCVKDGEHAWDQFQTTDPSVVVLDVAMPKLNGLEVLTRIRGSARPGTPVLLLSAMSRDSDVEQGYALGADDYLIKPFSPRDLLARVNALALRAR